MKFDQDDLNYRFQDGSAEAIIRYAIQTAGVSRIALASSLSIEDQVLTDLVLKINKEARIFFIDTGRHFQETYDLMTATMSKYNFHYEVYAPETEHLEVMVSHYGPNFFYESRELRKKCCAIRKVTPLTRVLSSVEGWICGLRKEQSLTRQEIALFEWDQKHSLYKINPLAFWPEEKVWEYLTEHQVPYNDLYNKGFPSIGCQPCTRAVKPGEDVRSGRWWWEEPDKKECGLHSPLVSGGADK